jgi:hypothetical protein
LEGVVIVEHGFDPESPQGGMGGIGAPEGSASAPLEALYVTIVVAKVTFVFADPESTLAFSGL